LSAGFFAFGGSGAGSDQVTFAGVAGGLSSSSRAALRGSGAGTRGMFLALL
jgi:hypothetical protein